MSGDYFFRKVAAACGLIVVLALSALTLKMLFASWNSLDVFGFSFVIGRSWDPVRELFGALPFIYGTLASSVVALAIALPVSFGVATFLGEFSPAWVRGPVSLLVELLAAIPSVIYGLWGIFALVPWLRSTVEPFLSDHFGFLPFFSGPHQGFGLLAGGIVLAIMILPTISAIMCEVFQAVPNTLRENALALGATKWEAVRLAVFPNARSGIVGAVILGLGRALGETMAVTMVIGNRAEISASVFAPSYTMAGVIANEFTEATGDLHLAALVEIGLLLFVVTVLLNVVARLFIWRMNRTAAGAVRL